MTKQEAIDYFGDSNGFRPIQREEEVMLHTDAIYDLVAPLFPGEEEKAIRRYRHLAEVLGLELIWRHVDWVAYREDVAGLVCEMDARKSKREEG